MNLSDIGITEFYGSSINYNNKYTLKEKYEDFVVKEITDDGVSDKRNFLNLKNLLDAYEWLKGFENFIKNEFVDNFHSSIKEFFENEISNNEYTKFSKFLNENEEKLIKKILIAEIRENEKEKRKFFYEKCRQSPFLFIISSDENILSIYFVVQEKSKFKSTLTKRNKNTIDACNIIAARLGLSSSSINFAGNKDKRAITHQEISIENSNFIVIFKLALELELKQNDIQLSNIRQTNSSIKLGKLIGNKFIIRIKLSKKFTDSLKPNNTTEENLNGDLINYFSDLDFSRLEKGFINYFGQQRFGISFSNHVIGDYILNKKYTEAINEIMKIIPSDDEKNIQAKKSFFEKEYYEAYKNLSSRLSTEKFIAKCKNNGFSDEKTIKKLKRETVKFYMHAYQSFIFNHEASEKIKSSKEKNDLENISDIELNLIVKNNRHMKGAKRKIIGKCEDLNILKENNSVVISFSLQTSCYATMALREIIGDDVFFL